MRGSVLFILLCTFIPLRAQLEVPVRVELNGGSDADRQVHGLAAPLTLDAAVSVAAARSTSMSYAFATGTDVLIASLVPAPAAYSTGMMVTIVPSSANTSGAMLDLNGMGARPIVKFGELPLDSADLQVGIPSRLVYDGARFLLLTNTARPCPPSFHAPASTYCIQDSSNSPATFAGALIACHAIGARLCSHAEWTNACRIRPSFIGTVFEREWVDNAANNSNDAKTVGAGWETSGPVPGVACNYGYTTQPQALVLYRCCMSR